MSTRFRTAGRAVEAAADHEAVTVEAIVETTAEDLFKQQLSAEALEAAMRSALEAKCVAPGLGGLSESCCYTID